MSEQNVRQEPESVKPKTLITDRELRRRLGDISAVTLWRLRRDDPRFPQPVRMLNHNNLVVEADCEAYIEALVAERDSRAA